MAAIPAIRSAVGSQLISSKMLDARSAMTTATKHPYLVYKIAFLQLNYLRHKDIALAIPVPLKYKGY